MTVTDEGTAGSIKLIDAGSVTPNTNKLDNNSGNLFWNGTQLGTGTSNVRRIDDLSDAIHDGSSVYLGDGSGIVSVGGRENTAVGKDALRSNTEGMGNTAIGYWALFSNIDGVSNNAIGYYALISNTDGSGNTANGYYALTSNTRGSENTANGFEALFKNTTGHRNTANGMQALHGNGSGSGNTATGCFALNANKSGSNNTANGHNAGPTVSNLSNTTALGNGASISASDQVVIGNSSVISIGGNVDWSIVSDGRYKNNIRQDVTGIDFIMGLRPITYNLNVQQLADKLGENIRIDENGNRVSRELSIEEVTARQKKASKREVGFVAQEVEELANELGFDFSGVEVPENEQSMYRLRYAEFVVPLVKAVQEQQELIAELRAEIDELKSR